MNRIESEEDSLPQGGSVPAISYHYCGLDRFVRIVKDKTLRLCNLFHMNDSREVSWFFDIASKRIEDLLAGPSDGGSGSGSLGWPQNVLARLSSLIKAARFYHVYAACFSEDGDSLSQWRGYADDGRGVTLGLDLEEVRKHANCRLLQRVRVNYEPGEAEQRVDAILAPLSAFAASSSSSSSSENGPQPRPAIQFLRQLAREAPGFKNPAFKHEREVRLVVRTPVPPDEDLDPSCFDGRWFDGFPFPKDPIWFCQGRSGFAPYARVGFPASAVRKVGFGPKFGGYANEVALTLFCRKKFPGCAISFYKSEASYR
jgi:hypothetical protein